MEKDAKIAELEAEIKQLKEEIRFLLEQLKLARHHRFGASSEKHNSADQLSLLDLLGVKKEHTIPAQEPRSEKVKGYRRRKAGEIGISRLPKDLPVEIVEHRLPPEELFCPECGEPLHPMGTETREELKFVPAKAVIVRHVSYTYSCRGCEKHSDHVPMVKSRLPEPVIKGSFASPEALAHIICQKFVMGLPLYRQEQEWARKGIELPRQTMSGWMIRATRDWIFPVYDALKVRLVKQEVLHADETTVQVLREPSKKPESKSYMWLYRTGCDSGDPMVAYEYRTSRKASHPKEFLQGFKGYLHTDGYDGYHDLPPEVTVVGCWAHLRRRFNDALNTIPKLSQANSPPMEGLRFIGELYKLEEQFRELPADDHFKARLAARQAQSKPIVQAFFEWCKDQHALPKSLFGKAISYALSQRVWLENYLLDGRLEIDNNRAERSIKPFVIGRKNWLFCSSQDGARVSAALYSIVETAKENGIDPFIYLTFLFRRAPEIAANTENPDWEAMLPISGSEFSKWLEVGVSGCGGI